MLDGLNEAQRRAVEADDGPVLIMAGPGTGKTKTLTARIAYLLREKKIQPVEIVALTFTNKSARELRERFAKLLSANQNLPKLTTFHALGAELLKRHGFDETLVNERRRADIIRELGKPAGLKGLNARELSLLISRAKTSIVSDPLSPSLRLPSQHDASGKAINQLLGRYEGALAELGLHDFDDLLTKTYKLLHADESKRPGYKYVLVDEFQDTSELQYELLKLLGAAKNLFVIGDPKQSIYAFRGAGTEMFERFRADYPDVYEVDLTSNYRSRQEIIHVVNAVFPDAPQLRAHHSKQGNAQVVQTLNEYSEAAYILGEIEKGIGGSDMLKASGHHDVYEPRDYAVLYRTHRAAKTLQRAFSESGIPYQIAGEGSPYEQPEVRGIIEIMRYLDTPDEQAKAELTKLPALKRPTPSQIETLLVKFEGTNELTVSDLATKIAKTFWDAPTDEKPIQQFLGTLVQYGSCEKGLSACLAHIDEISEGEFYDPTVNSVALLTIHASKGLEFSHVFLIAAEEGILPKLTKSGDGNIDEERRLFYVALSRAKENLEITHGIFRGGERVKVSRFVRELPERLLPRSFDPDMQALEHRAEKRRQKRAQGSLF